MFKTDKVSTETVDLLLNLDSVITEFYLAGGTALSMYFQHRQSDDLDFFSEKNINPERLLHELTKKFSDIKDIKIQEGTLLSTIRGVKVSFMEYMYPMINPPNHWNQLKIASIHDIACMKMVAIASRSVKKDYFDLYEILKHITPSDVIDSLVLKYGNKIDLYPFIIALTYFVEADKQPDPYRVNHSWGEIKKYLLGTQAKFYEALKNITNKN
jgi:predicted nucleotidyltransferase component of viral defense system